MLHRHAHCVMVLLRYCAPVEVEGVRSVESVPRVRRWSISEAQAARGVPAGIFFALGAGVVAAGLAVFEATVVPVERAAEAKRAAAKR